MKGTYFWVFALLQFLYWVPVTQSKKSAPASVSKDIKEEGMTVYVPTIYGSAKIYCFDQTQFEVLQNALFYMNLITTQPEATKELYNKVVTDLEFFIKRVEKVDNSRFPYELRCMNLSSYQEVGKESEALKKILVPYSEYQPFSKPHQPVLKLMELLENNAASPPVPEILKGMNYKFSYQSITDFRKSLNTYRPYRKNWGTIKEFYHLACLIEFGIQVHPEIYVHHALNATSIHAFPPILQAHLVHPFDNFTKGVLRNPIQDYQSTNYTESCSFLPIGPSFDSVKALGEHLGKVHSIIPNSEEPKWRRFFTIIRNAINDFKRKMPNHFSEKFSLDNEVYIDSRLKDGLTAFRDRQPKYIID